MKVPSAVYYLEGKPKAFCAETEDEFIKVQVSRALSKQFPSSKLTFPPFRRLKLEIGNSSKSSSFSYTLPRCNKPLYRPLLLHPSTRTSNFPFFRAISRSSKSILISTSISFNTLENSIVNVHSGKLLRSSTLVRRAELTFRIVTKQRFRSLGSPSSLGHLHHPSPRWMARRSTTSPPSSSSCEWSHRRSRFEED